MQLPHSPVGRRLGRVRRFVGSARRNFRYTPIARKLHHNQTDAGMFLWSQLRTGWSAGTNFRRPVPVTPDVLDFCNEKECLIIEMGDSQHMDTVRANQVRTAFLNAAIPACSDSGTTMCSRILVALAHIAHPR